LGCNSGRNDGSWIKSTRLTTGLAALAGLGFVGVFKAPIAGLFAATNLYEAAALSNGLA